MDEAPMGNSFVFDPNDNNQIAEMIRNHAAIFPVLKPSFFTTADVDVPPASQRALNLS